MSARQLRTFAVIVACVAAVNVAAQGRGGRGGGAPAGPARTNPPVDLTGTWVPVITEDWRYRMMTAPNGETGGIPMSATARQAAMQWDRSKDGSCQAYGVGGLMRMPVRCANALMAACMARPSSVPVSAKPPVYTVAKRAPRAAQSSRIAITRSAGTTMPT